MANERDCENCIHKVNGACKVWECKFEPKREMTKEEAIEIIECGEISNRWGKDGEEVEKMAIEALKQEPKTGHWIETAEEYYKAINEKGGGVNENTPYFTDDIACSECLAKFSVIDNETERFICCPNCGSKMESEETKMLWEEMEKYTELTGEDGTHVPIMKLGAYLDGYEKGKEVLDKIRAEIMDCLKALDEIEKSGLNIYLPNEISGRRLTYQQCLGFIDKYKAESEKKE